MIVWYTCGPAAWNDMSASMRSNDRSLNNFRHSKWKLFFFRELQYDVAANIFFLLTVRFKMFFIKIIIIIIFFYTLGSKDPEG